MNRQRTAALVCALVMFGRAGEPAAQSLQIGIIDLYGLGRVSEHDVRRALTIREGDTVSLESDGRPAFLAESERRLSTVRGVVRARLSLVCCDAGRGIVYVGIEENGRSATRFRAAPRGNARLAADIVQAGTDLSRASAAAVQRGDVAEDDSQGHALSHDPATRAIQQRFVSYAARDKAQLRRVLRDSSDAEQRALAAEALGYAADKQAVVGDLLYAMGDASADVRNNAMRALVVFARAAASRQPTLRVPYDRFIALLASPVWTDRNKASWALAELSEPRDPGLLKKLRREAIVPLVEMARWKSEGHAMPALMILGRIGGLSDEAVLAAMTRGEREATIKAAIERQ